MEGASYASINGCNVAVVGCCHGELDAIYASLAHPSCVAVDLLLVCGDFQCVRDMIDLNCVAMPQKYRQLNTFHQYVNGEKLAPVMTIFVGGNHEASNLLQSLYYGGYVAPRIYFLGFAGVVNYKGIRISGISGIFNQKHYRLGGFFFYHHTELSCLTFSSLPLSLSLSSLSLSLSSRCFMMQVILRGHRIQKTQCAACII